jgi:hypothetical protein
MPIGAFHKNSMGFNTWKKALHMCYGPLFMGVLPLHIYFIYFPKNEKNHHAYTNCSSK